MTTQHKPEELQLTSPLSGSVRIGTMVSLLGVCLDDAQAPDVLSKYNLVCAWAKRSLAYGVGIFHLITECAGV